MPPLKSPRMEVWNKVCVPALQASGGRQVLLSARAGWRDAFVPVRELLESHATFIRADVMQYEWHLIVTRATGDGVERSVSDWYDQ
jgi:hypothetical protein